MNVTIVQADENGRRIECDLRVAANDSLQRERITMDHGFGHPGIGRGKAVGIELVLSEESIDRRAMVKRVALLS